MDFNLVLGEDMRLTSKGEVVMRQGSHLMDNIVIDLGGKYQGASAYLEFDLPKSRKYVTPTASIAGNISYSVPGDVTANSGFGYMQLTILAGEIVEKSALFAFEVISSICASHYYADKDKHDFFFNADEILRESKMQVEASRQATQDAKKSVTDMNALKADIESKLESGAFKGEKGDKGADGRNGIDGVDGKNGENGIDGINGADGANGIDGVTPHIGANGNWFIDKVDTLVRATAKDGAPGVPGVTPSIGENKHWYIGDIDTGVVAEGKGGATIVQELGNSTTACMSQDAVTKAIGMIFNRCEDVSQHLEINLDEKIERGIFGFLYVYEEKVQNKYNLTIFCASPANNDTGMPVVNMKAVMSRGITISVASYYNAFVLSGINDHTKMRGCLMYREI